jgi:hypothetical protein
VKGREVVVGDHNQGSLIKTPLHRMIKLLAKDTCSIKGVSTAMGGIG